MAGFTDPSQFVQRQLNDPNDPQKQLPQMDPLGATRVGLQVAGFAPGAGLASGLGMFPKAEGGYEPSLKQNIQDKNYGTAALQGFGMLADVAGLGGVARGAAKIPAVGNFLANEVGAAKIGSRSPTPLSPLGYYSKGVEAAKTLQPKGTVGQLRPQIERMVPKAEREYSQFDRVFPASDPNRVVTRDQIGEHFHNAVNFGDTGSILREKINREMTPEEARLQQSLLAQIPGPGQTTTRAQAQASSRAAAQLDQLPGEPKYGPTSQYGENFVTPGIQNYEEGLLHYPWYGNGIFLGDHWTHTPNVVAHRRSGLIPVEGRDGLGYIHEEGQSDWAQRARNKGFFSSDDRTAAVEQRWQHSAEMDRLNTELRRAVQNRASPDEVAALREQLMGADERFEDAAHMVNKIEERPPVGPWVGNTNDWERLILRRALYDSAQKNANSFLWTPGAQQVERWGLDAHVDELRHLKLGRDKYAVQGFYQGDPVFAPPFANDWDLQDIANRFGADAARLVQEGKTGHMDGRFSPAIHIPTTYLGKGMVSAYDDRLPNHIQHIFKKDLGLEPNMDVVNVMSSEGPMPKAWVETGPKVNQRILERGFPYFAGAPIAYGMMQPQEEQR